jgi:HlyD family secretion protein
VQAGATALSLSLEKPVWVRAYVHERELGWVPPGTRVLVATDGQAERRFHGKVGFVSPRAEFTPKSVETPELRTSLVYRLRVVVEDSDGTLRQGMPVTVMLDPTPQ